MQELPRYEAPVFRHRQAEIRPQRRAFVPGAVKAAPLQLGDDFVDEIVERTRQIGRQQIEPVGGLADEPMLELVGHLFGGAPDRKCCFDETARRATCRSVRFSRRAGDDAAWLRPVELEMAKFSGLRRAAPVCAETAAESRPGPSYIYEA